MAELPAHAERNRESWDADSDAYQARHGEQLRVDRPGWGVWQLPEAEVGALGEVSGLDVLEFGCGAAQWSIALAHAGARPVGLDLSARQLDHARRLMAVHGVDFPLVEASAEHVPLPDASFDLVFCDHGAMTFADPRRTVPEASRLLRPGGRLVFCMGTPILDICWPADAEHPGTVLHLDYFGLHRLEQPDTTDFQLTYGEWIRCFRDHGLVVEDLIELRPPADATSTYRGPQDLAWARRWPMEHIWSVRRGEGA